MKVVFSKSLEKFGYPDTLIYEFEHWILLLRQAQVTLASMILYYKKSICSWSNVESAGFSELKTVFSKIEKVLLDSMGAKKINFLSLMLVDPVVHMHVIPRYDEPKIFNNEQFIDKEYPRPPLLNQFCQYSKQTKILLIEKLQSEFISI